MKKFYVASITPFDRENKLNVAAMHQLMERNLREGADGFFVGGSAGECFLLTQAERAETFAAASAFLDRADLYAHVGAISTAEAVALAKEAKRCGIKKIAATPPFYFGFSNREVADYFHAIADAAGEPVLFYNIPSSTFRTLDPNDPDLRALLTSGAICGIKHTNLDLLQMERIRNVNDKLLCLGGFETCMLAFLGFDCDGFIGSTFNFMLPQFREIARLYASGAHEEAKKRQRRANNVVEAVLRLGLPASLKYLATKAGVDAGRVRPPFRPLDAAAAAQLDEIIAENLDRV